MSATKAFNYRNFLDTGDRVLPKPTTLERGEGGADIGSYWPSGNMMVHGSAPMTFVIRPSGSACWVKSDPEAFGEWLRRIDKKIYGHIIYSGGGSAIVEPVERPDDFGLLRDKVRGLLDLPRGWDSYEAEAPSTVAVEAALTLINALKRLRILPEWVTPTADSSILVRYRSGDIWYDWEFHSDGDVAVMRKPLFDRETYHDLTAGEVADFIARFLLADE